MKKTVSVLGILCLLTMFRFAAADDLCEAQAVTLLGFEQLTKKNVFTQMPITEIPEKVTTGKSVILNNIASITINHKKKLLQKEATLILWVNFLNDIGVNPAKAKKSGKKDAEKNEVKEGNERHQTMHIGLGEFPPELDSNQFLANRFGVNTKIHPKDPRMRTMFPVSANGGEAIQTHTLPDMSGWRQVALCVVDKYTAVYIDGVLVSFGKQGPEKPTTPRLLPGEMGALTLRNGAINEANSNFDRIAIRSVILINRCLKYDEVRNYRQNGELPEDAKASWTVDFAKGNPSEKAEEVKTFGNVSYAKTE